MTDDHIIRDNSIKKVANALYEDISDEERRQLSELPTIDIDLEQV